MYRNIRHLLIAACLCKLMTTTCLNAAIFYWDGTDTTADPDGGGGTWNTTNTNWDNATAAGLSVVWGNATSSDAVFGGAAGPSTITVGTVTANDMSFDTDGYTLTGGTITLNRPGGSDNPNITVAAGVTTTIASALAGSRAITKDGAGKLILSGANSFTGTVNVSLGVLNIRSNTALGGAGSGASITAGAALEIQNTITVGTEAITLNGTGISGGGALRNVSGNNSMAGAITLGSASEIASDAGTLTLSGNIGGSGRALTFDGAGDTIVSGVIGTGTGTITKNGSGTVTLTRANTYTGLTTVSAGTLAYGITNALSSGAVTVSGGTLDLKTFNDTVGAVTLTSGTITSTTGVLTATSYSVESGTLSAILAGGVALTKTTAGTVTLTRANTYTGVTTVSAGTLSVATLGNGGAAGNLGQATNAAANLVLNGGTLLYTGATASTDRLLTIGASGGTIDASGTGAITFANTGAAAYGATGSARTITLSGANTGDNTFALNLGDNGTGKTAFIKDGVGKWIVTATSGRTGTTTVNSGFLVMNASVSGSATTVNSGGTLAGTGTTGALTLNSGAFLTPGAGTGSIDTLSAGAFTWNGGGTLSFDLGASGVNDRLALTGALTKGSAGSYSFDFLGTGVNGGSYTLITAGSVSGFTTGNFTATNLASGLAGNIAVLGNNVVITVVPEPQEYALVFAGGAALLAALKRRKRR